LFCGRYDCAEASFQINMAKRIFDFFFALVGTVVSAPVLLLCAAVIKLTSDGPVFYRGLRIGLNGKPFRIFKFRTMLVDAERLGGTSTSKDDKRITWVGKVIRAYKFDEFPQLFNVLAGDMSFVGPRPQVEWAVKLYNIEERRLLSVRPGITDYASIAFRNEAEILAGSKDPDKDYLEKIAPKKIQLGLQYVDNHNLWIDLKIILATLHVVIFG